MQEQKRGNGSVWLRSRPQAMLSDDPTRLRSTVLFISFEQISQI